MHLLNSFIGFSSRLLLLAVFGWKVALVSIAAGLAAQQMPFLLNFICHIPQLGYRNYKGADDSVNVWWVAILTTGEGWHNNHHHTPGSAKSGLRWFEVDLAYLTIKGLSAIGLVKRMNIHKDKREVASKVLHKPSSLPVQLSVAKAVPIPVESAMSDKLAIAK